MPSDFAAEIQRLGAIMRRADPHATEIAARLERFDAAVLVADDDGRYVAANERASQLTGYTRAELLTLTVADLTPVAHTPEFHTLWREFIAAGTQKGPYQLQRRDGSVVLVDYAAWANVAPGRHVTVLTSR
jgi:PAS domain S-box-containing protein